MTTLKNFTPSPSTSFTPAPFTPVDSAEQYFTDSHNNEHIDDDLLLEELFDPIEIDQYLDWEEGLNDDLLLEELYDSKFNDSSNKEADINKFYKDVSNQLLEATYSKKQKTDSNIINEQNTEKNNIDKEHNDTLKDSVFTYSIKQYEDMFKVTKSDNAISKTLTTSEQESSLFKFFKSIGQSFSSAFGVKILSPWEKESVKIIEQHLLNNDYKAILQIDLTNQFISKSLKKQCVTLIEKFVHSDVSSIEIYFYKAFEKNKSISSEYLISFLFCQQGKTARMMGLQNDNSQLGKNYHLHNQQEYKKIMNKDYDAFYQYIGEQLQQPLFKMATLNYWRQSLHKVYKMRPTKIFKASYFDNNKETEKYIKDVNEAGSSISFLYNLYNIGELCKHDNIVKDFKKTLTIYSSFAHFRKTGYVGHFPVSPSVYNKRKECTTTLYNGFNTLSQNLSALSQFTFNKNIYKVEHNPSNSVMTKLTVDTSFEYLPIKAKNIINSIHSSYSYISKNMHNVSQCDSMNIENIIVKRIPEVITKYLDLSDSSRDTRKNIDGKTPTDLLILSLNNFYQILSHIVDNIEEEKINSLSATERYTETIKNNYVGIDNNNSIIDSVNDKVIEKTNNNIEMEIGNDERTSPKNKF